MKNAILALSPFLLAGTLILSSCASESNKPSSDLAEEAELYRFQEDDPAIVERNDPLWQKLEKKDFLGALELSMSYGNFDLIYYLAECVIETTELENFVREKCPAVPEQTKDGEEPSIDDGQQITRELRYVLARRLMRENLPSRAREYFPEELLPEFDNYVAANKKAYDLTLGEGERAKAFWEAALIVRGNGDALFATSFSPETLLPANCVFDGSGEDFSELAVRRRASRLALYAASLLPNNDERTARILLTAGTWLRARDAEGANLFYKLIAIRCPDTKIGKESLMLHWLPANLPWKREEVWDGVNEE
ncbi:MAG: hypothetical protein K6B46_05740 [Opitutales bacterium]|nr:hypothetical protein [Opitutales bacterium]